TKTTVLATTGQVRFQQTRILLTLDADDPAFLQMERDSALRIAPGTKQHVPRLDNIGSFGAVFERSAGHQPGRPVIPPARLVGNPALVHRRSTVFAQHI